jgi:hypothetical protein
MKSGIRWNKTFFIISTVIFILNKVESSFLDKQGNQAKSTNLIEKEKEIISFIDSSLDNKIKNKCNYENCPLLQGVCYEDNCLCSYGFKTYMKTNDPVIYCNYKQRSRMTAFFLEFFFPIGLGHLYAGKITLALIKFGLFIGFFIGLCGELMCIKLNFEKLVVCSAFTLLADMCLWISIQLVDLVCYALGYYSDGNGVQLI